MKICYRDSCTEELTGRSTKFCSSKCKNNYYVTASRRNAKRKLVAHFGGKCTWCGYNKSVAALQFHHQNDDKEFGIGGSNIKSYAKLLAEAEKCVLICANCHAEHHSK
jgi:hypothetical protein